MHAKEMNEFAEITFNNDKHNFYKDYEDWDMYNSGFKSTQILKHDLPRLSKIKKQTKNVSSSR